MEFTNQSTNLVKCNWAGEEFVLLPEKAIWWERKQTLLLADLHFGKIGHFRKAGIALPQNGFKGDLAKLDQLIATHQPKRLLVLGDVFHSDYNAELDYFGEWRSGYPDLDFSLVPGNHDVLDKPVYQQLNFKILSTSLCEGEIEFCHDPEEDALEGTPATFRLSGHVHPGVKLSGKGPQRLQLPCFYFGKRQALLPAFGHFTGKHCLKPKRGDQVFVIANEEVIAV